MKETLPEPEPGVLAKAGTPENHQALQVEPQLMADDAAHPPTAEREVRLFSIQFPSNQKPDK